MKCQRCDSERIMELTAKCPDRYGGQVGEDQFESPCIEGLCDGEYVVPKVCLDCGQCQGEWPVAFDEEPYVFVPPLPTFDSVREWLDACKEHTCTQKKMVSADLPPDRMGYSCMGCGKWFGVKLSTCKRTVEDLGDAQAVVKASLKTREGRTSLAAAFN